MRLRFRLPGYTNRLILRELRLMSQVLTDLTNAVSGLESAVANLPASDGATAAELQPLVDRINTATTTLTTPPPA